MSEHTPNIFPATSEQAYQFELEIHRLRGPLPQTTEDPRIKFGENGECVEVSLLEPAPPMLAAKLQLDVEAPIKVVLQTILRRTLPVRHGLRTILEVHEVDPPANQPIPRSLLYGIISSRGDKGNITWFHERPRTELEFLVPRQRPPLPIETHIAKARPGDTLPTPDIRPSVTINEADILIGWLQALANPGLQS